MSQAIARPRTASTPGGRHATSPARVWRTRSRATPPTVTNDPEEDDLLDRSETPLDDYAHKHVREPIPVEEVYAETEESEN